MKTLLLFTALALSPVAAKADFQKKGMECAARFNWITQAVAAFGSIQQGTPGAIELDPNFQSGYRYKVRTFGLDDGKTAMVSITAYNRKGNELTSASGVLSLDSLSRIELSLGKPGKNQVNVDCHRLPDSKAQDLGQEDSESSSAQ